MSAPSAATRVRALSVHAAYRCADTGVCCSSGWDIPVEPPAEAGLRRAIGEGRLVPADALRPAAGLPHGARVVLARDVRTGRCAFQEPGPPSRCAVHARLGDGALPSACRQFPRVATLSPLGVSVTLSHYCPTAAGLLFEASGALRIVEGPPAFPAAWPFDGLDARGALPPLLRPGVLASWAALETWEEHAVATLADESVAPDEAVSRLGAAAESARAWAPDRGTFDAFLEEALSARAVSEPVRPIVLDAIAAWDLVASTVPPGSPRPSRPPLAASCPALPVDAHAPVRRWLAARAFASWLPLQGPGLRTAALGLAVALATLRAELARGGRDAAADAPSLVEAIRRADLLLLHLADPQALADRLGACEKAGGGRVLASLLRA
jgi:hypothetical protein